MKKTVYFLLLCVSAIFYSCSEDDSSQLKHGTNSAWQQKQITFSEFLKSEGNKSEIKKIQKYFQGYFSDFSNKGGDSINWEIDTTIINKIVTQEVTTYTFGVIEHESIEGFRNVVVEIKDNSTNAFIVHYPNGLDSENYNSQSAFSEEIGMEIWGKSITCYKVVYEVVGGCSDGECEYGWTLVEIPCNGGGCSSCSGSGGNNGGNNGGTGGEGGNSGTPTGPVNGGFPPMDGGGQPGGGGGSNAYTQLEDDLYSIAGPNDYFEVGVTIPSNSPSFTSVDQFESYLDSFIEVVESKTISNQSGNQRTLKTRIQRTPFSGIDILTDIEKNNNIYTLLDVNSNEWGMTLGYDWEQYTYNQSTNSGIITINVYGYETYTVFIEGIGTIYSKYKTFQVKINNSTGLLL